MDAAGRFDQCCHQFGGIIGDAEELKQWDVPTRDGHSEREDGHLLCLAAAVRDLPVLSF